MNEKVIEVRMSAQRSISTVTAEILTYKNQYKQQTIYFLLEVGKRLVEAKSMLDHGEWADWLEKEVEFKASTANNLMRIYQDYGTGQARIDGAGNPQAIENLSYTQIVRLLSVPLEERDSFIKDNDIENKSSREIEQLVRERDDARRKLQDTSARLDQAEKDRAATEAVTGELRKKYDQAVKDLQQADSEAQEADSARKAAEEKVAAAKAAEKKAKDKLKELKENPTVPPEVLDKVKAEAEAAAKAAAEQELAAKTEELRSAAEKAKRDAEEATKSVERAKADLEETRKALALASPDMTAFKIHFETVQKDFSALVECLQRIKAADPATGDKMTAAVNAVLQAFTQQIGG